MWFVSVGDASRILANARRLEKIDVLHRLSVVTITSGRSSASGRSSNIKQVHPIVAYPQASVKTVDYEWRMSCIMSSC